MSVRTALATPTTITRRRGITITLWALQVLAAAFMLIGAAIPKLVGQQYAVDLFDQIGAGQWLRYLVGVLELAGAVGLLVPRLSGLAATGLVALMVGATFTQIVVLHAPLTAVTPVLFGVFFGVIAWGRRAETRSLASRLHS